MKCYLHIGTEKTGTTSIQLFFSDNRTLLAEKGYYYLESLGLPHNKFLPLAAINLSRRYGLTKKLKLITDDELLEFQKNIQLRLKNEVEKLPHYAKVICSSEHIQSRLTTVEEIERLKIILNEVGLDDITVIVYFRNPSKTANSLFSTSIKGGETLRNVPPPTEEYYENICNHKKTVEKFASVFSKEKIVIRLFRKDKFKNHSLIHDISSIIGIDSYLDELTIPEHQNKALSLLGLMILRNLNEKIPIYNSDGVNNQRNDLVNIITEYFSEPKFVMDKELYQAYDSYFAQSNQWIRENYFPEEEELFPYEIPQPSQCDIPEDTLMDITNLIADIWISRSVVINDKWYHFGKITNKQKFIVLYKYALKKLKKLPA